jgi:hypothetical protein
MSQPRRYPPEALALFAEYRDRREPYRPIECHNGSPCWVEDGPPSITSVSLGNRCTGCGASPLAFGRRHRRDADGPL